uniref:Uncharacterized protein n=1 Tax=Aegilops tauschii subsp. strangulata TaxID=200361 RepID=A0A452Z9H5_AEGTS
RHCVAATSTCLKYPLMAHTVQHHKITRNMKLSC